ncbi:uncharacterized protein LOC143898874 isoform X2 [Temnothorax americanus]|uniref:uncharacterized protein LOC143898874 isoform X2 n=1 Tax=Temnothorax americanus TaxID=1964332 RepID=UPI0040682E8F
MLKRLSIESKMDSQEQIRIVHTCGVCEEICDEIIGHQCMEGYSRTYIDKNNYFYPMSDDGKTAIVRRSMMPNNTEKIILDSQENVNPNIRKLNAAEIQKKFKSLRDTYRKIVQTEQHASGSARIEPKEKWKHYDVMNFLRDSCLIRPTQTNVSRDSVCEDSREDEIIVDAGTSNVVDRDADEDCSLASASTETRKISRKNTPKDTEEAESAINRIADAMCRENPNIVLPAPPQPDEVDSMLHAAGLQLRRLSYRRRMQTLFDIVEMVHIRLMDENIEETP